MKTFKEFRIEKGISASHIAKVMGISRATLWNKENGRTLFTIPEANMYCQILGIKPELVKELEIR